MNPRRALLGSLVVALVVSGATAAPAHSRTAPDRAQSIAKKLTSPLSLAVSDDGTVYYTQNFAGMLMARTPGQRPRVVHQARKRGTEIGGVSEHLGSLRFVSTKGKAANLWGIGGNGVAVKLADLAEHETTENPDADVAYGFTGLDPACAALLPPELPAGYTGIVESHPYATLMDGPTTYVADAAGNTLLAVKGDGRVKTVAVLPPVPVEITAEIAAANELPSCVVGLTYAFEAVPTDVEAGKGRRVYVSTLPGGPENGSTGAQAKVYEVNTRTGVVRVVAEGLVSATGIAVSPRGDLYVAQLFAGTIARVKGGSGVPRPFAEAPLPADLEWGPDGLYGTTHALVGLEEGQRPGGRVVHWR